MRKFLPIFLFLIGLIAIAAVYFFVVKGKKEQLEAPTGEERALIEIPLDKRPIVSLTPTSDGHYLNLKIEKIVIPAASLDYELLYSVPGGRTQGVPGTISLTGQTEIERKLLLGSESSGKFRYDEGVQEGTLTLRFRDDKGGFIARFSTDFYLVSNTDSLTSIDGNFSAKLNKKSKAFFVVMETFGVPENPSGKVVSGPYGIFASSKIAGGGSVDLKEGKVYRWAADMWTNKVSGDAFDTGIFIGTSE